MFGKTSEMTEGSCIVMSVADLNRPNTGKDGDICNVVAFIVNDYQLKMQRYLVMNIWTLFISRICKMKKLSLFFA